MSFRDSIKKNIAPLVLAASVAGCGGKEDHYTPVIFTLGQAPVVNTYGRYVEGVGLKILDGYFLEGVQRYNAAGSPIQDTEPNLCRRPDFEAPIAQIDANNAAMLAEMNALQSAPQKYQAHILEGCMDKISREHGNRFEDIYCRCLADAPQKLQ
jgi:hypothetical protein